MAKLVTAFEANNALDSGRTKEEKEARWHYLFKMSMKIDKMKYEKVSPYGYHKRKTKKEVDSLNETEE